MENHAKRGFTLIELIVVLAVLGLLLAIAIPNYMLVRERSMIRAMNINCEHLKDCILFVQSKDQPSLFYKPNQADGGTSQDEHDSSLSGCVENEIELVNGAGDADNTTTWRFVNPYSKKDGIINWHRVGLVQSSPYDNRALMLSNDASLDPADGISLGGSKEEAAGMVVGYFEEDAKHIWIYWIDQDGNASEKKIDLDLSDQY